MHIEKQNQAVGFLQSSSKIQTSFVLREIINHTGKSTVSIGDLQKIYPGIIPFQIGEFLSDEILSSKTSDHEVAAIWGCCGMDIKQLCLYPDAGEINTDLAEKLDITGSDFCKAFLEKHKENLLLVETAPVHYQWYEGALGLLLDDFLATSKKVRLIKPMGKLLLEEFLSSFEIELLASLVIRETRKHDQAMPDLEDETSPDDGEEFFSGSYIKELKNSLRADRDVPVDLVFSSWIQACAPQVFKKIRSLLIGNHECWKIRNPRFWKEIDPDVLQENTREYVSSGEDIELDEFNKAFYQSGSARLEPILSEK